MYLEKKKEQEFKKVLGCPIFSLDLHILIGTMVCLPYLLDDYVLINF